MSKAFTRESDDLPAPWGSSQKLEVRSLPPASCLASSPGWLSPIANILLNARLGQRLRFKFPSGEAELEVIHLAHE